MSDNSVDSLSQENAKILAQLIVDPATSDHVKVAILNKLMEIRQERPFFETIFQDKLSFSACPCCGHENHWAIPEVNLKQMGYITSEVDPRVKKKTTVKDCVEFQEACPKRKVNM